MQQPGTEDLRLVGVDDEGTRLVVEDQAGARFTLPLDERLHAALRGDRARLGQLQISIEGQLRPREIQTRIRAGETAEAIASSAGLPVESVRRFEGPILLERTVVAQEAQAVGVRRVTDSVTTPLGELVGARLAEHQVDEESLDWDSWLNPDGRWLVRLSYDADGQQREATWWYDPRRRSIEPADDEARWLTDDERAPSALPPSLPRLERVTYESRLGSYRDKVERVRSIARWLAEQWYNLGIQHAHVSDADRAAELAKCDLATEMVREFPELQGIVGGLYARAQGEPDEVADAVYDHYRPVGLDDPIPRNLTGSAVALADKLDSVVGCFAVGVVPSGSSDPYALRRAALGIVKIILERKLPLSLSSAIRAAARVLLTLKPKRSLTPEQEKQILDFVHDRARFVFREREGFAYDEVNAVFRAGADDLVDAHKRLVALRAIRRSKNFEPLAVSFKRIRKIVEKANLPALDGLRAEPDLFESDAERELHTAVREAAAKVHTDKRAGKYQEALEVIAGLRKSVDRFFDEVMVMAENESVRNNRLALLSELLREFTTVADFSEMGGDERG